jgi:hypothetical protein
LNAATLSVFRTVLARYGVDHRRDALIDLLPA